MLRLHTCKVILRCARCAARRGRGDGIQTGDRRSPLLGVRAACARLTGQGADRAGRGVRDGQRVIHAQWCIVVAGVRGGRRQRQRRASTRRAGLRGDGLLRFGLVQREARVYVIPDLVLRGIRQRLAERIGGRCRAALCRRRGRGDRQRIVGRDLFFVLVLARACGHGLAEDILRTLRLAVDQIQLAAVHAGRFCAAHGISLAVPIQILRRLVSCIIQHDRLIIIGLRLFSAVERRRQCGIRRGPFRNGQSCAVFFPCIGGRFIQLSARRELGRVRVRRYGIINGIAAVVRADADVSILVFYLVDRQLRAVRRGRRVGGGLGLLYRRTLADGQVVRLADVRILLRASASRMSIDIQRRIRLRHTDGQHRGVAVKRDRLRRGGQARDDAAEHCPVQLARYLVYGIGIAGRAGNVLPFAADLALLPSVQEALVDRRAADAYAESRRLAEQRAHVLIRACDGRALHIARQRLARDDLAFDRFVVARVIARGDRVFILRVGRKAGQRILIAAAGRFRSVHRIDEDERIVLIVLDIAVDLVILRRASAGIPRQHHAVRRLLAEAQILRRGRRRDDVTDQIAQHRDILSVELHGPRCKLPVEVVVRVVLAVDCAFLRQPFGADLFRPGAHAPVVAAADLEAACDAIRLHRAFIFVLKAYFRVRRFGDALGDGTCTIVLLRLAIAPRMLITRIRQAGAVGVRLAGCTELNVRADLVHIRIGCRRLIIRIHRDDAGHRFHRHGQHHRALLLRLRALRVLDVVQVIGHRRRIHND